MKKSKIERQTKKIRKCKSENGEIKNYVLANENREKKKERGKQEEMKTKIE